MSLTLRSCSLAGTLVIGAGVIVANPVLSTPPDLRIATPEVRLSGAADVYTYVLNTAEANRTALHSLPAPDPAGVLGDIIAEQPGSLRALSDGLRAAAPVVIRQLTTTAPTQVRVAILALEAGQVDAAVNTLMGVPIAVLRPVLAINPALASVVIGAIGPVVSGVAAGADAYQDIKDAVEAGDAHEAVEATLRAPAVVANGVLNGGYGPDFNPEPSPGTVVLAGGILSPGSTSGGRTILPGPLAALRGQRADAALPATETTQSTSRTQLTERTTVDSTDSTTTVKKSVKAGHPGRDIVRTALNPVRTTHKALKDIKKTVVSLSKKPVPKHESESTSDQEKNTHETKDD